MKKMLTGILICICAMFVFAACGSAGSDYLKGNLECVNTIAGVGDMDWAREQAKEASPYLLYLDGKGKFEAIMEEGSSDKLTGKYEIEIYPKDSWFGMDSNLSETCVEEGILTLKFDDKIYGTKEYEYLFRSWDGKQSVNFYYGGRGAYDAVDAGTVYDISSN